MKTPVLIALSLLPLACVTSTHPTTGSELGVARTRAELTAVVDAPGVLEVETIRSADWAVPLSGLLNLDHPAAAHLEDHDEPISIFFHVIRHPTRGTFIVDTGVEKALRDTPDEAILRGLIASAMNVDALEVKTALGDWLAREELAGVLLTHLHADHILGMRDVPRGTPIYLGPGETTPRAFMHMFSQGLTDEALEGQGALREWAFGADGVVDVFGDGSLWAIAAPGHTPGSTAYLARTARGPVLMVGDASHTAWGWEHGVEPGTFNGDAEQAKVSFDALQALVKAHPGMEVRLGHQEVGASARPAGAR